MTEISAEMLEMGARARAAASQLATAAPQAKAQALGGRRCAAGRARRNPCRQSP
jgi:hypothetical protein